MCVTKIMEAIKKKLATLKEEKENALEKAEDAETRRKEAEARAEAVSVCGWVQGGRRKVGWVEWRGWSEVKRVERGLGETEFILWVHP